MNLKQVIKIQYKKCYNDPIYFMKRYCYIIHSTKGKIRFQLYPFQQKLVQDIRKHRKNIILKSRQMGISTTSAGITMWRMMFRDNQTITIIANKQKVAKNLLNKIIQMYKNLPTWFKQICPMQFKNATSFGLKNGSEVYVQAATEDAGRSRANSLLIIDQMAIINDRLARQIWGSANLTLATGGDCILLSTPKGIGSQFHQLWTNAEAGKNGFNFIRLPWFLNPDFNQQWRDAQTLQLGQKLAAQQCDCSFLSSSDTVLDLGILNQYYQQRQEPIRKMLKQHLWIWKLPEPGKKYVIGADVARGDGSDYSAFHVIDVVTMQQVAQYQHKQDTSVYGKILVNIACLYNNAFLACQNATHGWDTIKTIIQSGYTNYYTTLKNETSYSTDKINNQMLSIDQNRVPGFTTSNKTRPLIINKMKSFIRNRTITLNSVRTIQQLTTFIYKNGKPQAMSGKNDDLVMSLAIAIWARDRMLQFEIIDQDYDQYILQNFSRNIDNRIDVMNNDLQRLNIPNQQIQYQDTELYKEWF